jgi:hypothetical protein
MQKTDNVKEESDRISADLGNDLTFNSSRREIQRTGK